MKRQKLRKALILISFLLFPVTIFYLSPYVIIQAGLEGVVSGSFLFFILLFVSSLFFGRAYCGWVCAPGGLQSCCSMVADKRFKGGKRNLIKYFVWVPWVISIILIFSVNGIKKVDPFFYTEHGISVVGIAGYVIYYGVVFLIVIMSFVSGKNAFCHSLCWMAPFMVIGSKIKNKLKYPSLHLMADNSKCVNCKKCTQKCPMSLAVHDMVLTNKMNHSECILCGECIDGCPKGAIAYKFKFE